MTEKEEFELVAKAVGLSGEYNGITGVWYLTDGERHPSGDPRRWWNPKTDDGDAFRLAVKLGMATDFCRCQASAYSVHWHYVDKDNDPCKAARLAIWRAAVEIAKEMK